MKTQFFCPRWGSEQLSWEIFCAEVRAAGYEGIEYAIAHTTTDRELEQAWNYAERNRLMMLPQHYDTAIPEFPRHLNAYHAWLERIKAYPAVMVNSQTGRDFFSFEQNSQLIGLAAEFSLSTGTPVCHETHRGKFSFAAHATLPYLQTIEDLKITLDISHWVNVAESYLDDQVPAVKLAIARTNHIHARIGHPEAPQVSDPRAPEWKEALDRHLNWWDQVAANKANQGQMLTITPEFGPFPYMVHLPATGSPIANQWEVNRYMMKLLNKRYN